MLAQVWEDFVAEEADKGAKTQRRQVAAPAPAPAADTKVFGKGEKIEALYNALQVLVYATTAELAKLLLPRFLLPKAAAEPM